MKHLLKQKLSKITIAIFLTVIVSLPLISAAPAYAGTICGSVANTQIKTTIDFGCLGTAGGISDPILDLLFGVLRFLSAGVGILVVASIVVAGIQYTLARDNPQNVESAINRIRSSIIALVIYIFAYAILNYLVPGGLFV